MERDIGIEGYLSTTRGLGGTLKSTPEDFVVDEISSPPDADPAGSYAIATIRSREWETNRLVRKLARALRISRRRIGFAGTKDKRAVTAQLFSFEGITPERLRELRIKDVEVTEVYQAGHPLEIGDLAGNRFRIRVRDLVSTDSEAAAVVRETTRQLTELGGFPNFFGVQRFGSVRPITHEVGRHLVRGEFREAVGTYVAHPVEGEDPESYEVRAALEASGDVKEALRRYPRSYTFEKAMLNHLRVRPDDFVGALRALPLNLLILFVHAYQSYMFNRILSERLWRGLPVHRPIVGDIVLAADARGLPDREHGIEVGPENVGRVAERCRAGKAWVSGILFGSEVTFADGVMGEIERGIVKREHLERKDFLIPQIPRISSKGTRREILAPFRDLAARVEDGALHVSVDLTRGAYATCLLREYMKTG